jgi:putative endonuclease
VRATLLRDVIAGRDPAIHADAPSAALSSLPGSTRQSMLTRRMKNYWVYILASRPRGTLYVGMTNDLVRRVYQHREGVADGFTKQYGTLSHSRISSSTPQRLQPFNVRRTSSTGRANGRSI